MKTITLLAILAFCFAAPGCGGARVPPPSEPVTPEIHGWYAITIIDAAVSPTETSGGNWDTSATAWIAGGIAVVGAGVAILVSLGTAVPAVIATAATAVGAVAATPVFKAIEGKTIAPDPKAVLRIGDGEVATAPVKNNAYARWNLTFLARVSRDEDHTLQIEVWDHDGWSDDDFIGETKVDLEVLLAKEGRIVTLDSFGAVQGVSLMAAKVAEYDAPRPPPEGALPLPPEGSVSVLLKRARIHRDRDVARTFDRVLRRRTGAVARCYDAALRDSPDIRGRMTIKLVVEADGRVKKARMKRDTAASETLTACVVEAIREWTLPSLEKRSVFVYTFVFDPGGGTISREDIDEALREDIVEDVEEGPCGDYQKCVKAMAEAMEDADFPGAKDAAKAMRDSAKAMEGMEGAAAESGCEAAMDAMKKSADAYKAMPKFEFPDECR